MSRTDRALLSIALILLLLTAASFFGVDRYFFPDEADDTAGAIAYLVNGQGDVRVKFNNEFQWQKGKFVQKLIYDDAVFSGEGSRAEINVGESRLTLEANTLVILRQEKSIRSLNLPRGMLSGMVAKGETLRIETGAGEKFNLTANEASQIVIRRDGAKTAVAVEAGNAVVVKDGKPQTLASRDNIEFIDQQPEKNDPIRILAPVRSRIYSRQSVAQVQFEWEYASRRAVGAGDEFIVEFSQEPVFTRIIMRENLLGQTRLAATLPLPQTIFYRIKDGKGGFSPVRRLALDRPDIPRILAPHADEEIEAAKGETVPVMIVLSPPQAEGRQQVQIARMPDFADPGTDVEISAGQLQQRFSAGEYFVRARARFPNDGVDGEWSQALRFTVREKVNPLDVRRADLPALIVIPNLTYPKQVYRMPDAAVQSYLATMAPFPEFFANLQFENRALLARRRGRDTADTKIAGGQFPAAWLYPGLIDVVYHLEGLRFPPKTHRMVIRMEAPNGLTADAGGRATWSPILFARSYEGRLRAESGGETEFSSRDAQIRLDVAPGTSYAYRVRAIGARGVPISDWSEEYGFTTPAPPSSAPEVTIAEQKPLEREPAQEKEKARLTLKQDGEKPSIWQRIGWWLWAGSGYNYVNVRQTINNTADVEYKNTKGPSAYLEAGYLSPSRVGAVVSYKRTPGDVRVDNYPINEREFVWTTTSAEGLWVLPWRARVLKIPLLWTLRAGIQNHFFPFLYVGSGNQLVQGRGRMMTGTVGFLTESVGSRLKYYWSMRYQQPVSSGAEGGDSLEITPTVAFDGSVGASYHLTERLKTGLFWYGQLHAYDFKYQSQTQTNSGKQSLFYSNMEFRLGIDF